MLCSSDLLLLFLHELEQLLLWLVSRPLFQTCCCKGWSDGVVSLRLRARAAAALGRRAVGDARAPTDDLAFIVFFFIGQGVFGWRYLIIALINILFLSFEFVNEFTTFMD